MFRNDRQACLAIRALLATLHPLRAAWTLDGPTEQAVAWLRRSSLSHGEEVMLRVAFDLWNGDGGAKLADLIGVLDAKRSEAVLGLLLALNRGPRAVDEWIAGYEREGGDG